MSEDRPRGWNHWKQRAKRAGDTARKSASNTAEQVRNAIPAGFAFLSQEQLLKWSEQVTKSAATAYDKALDATYLQTHIGGGNHRMFDGGHDIAGAFQAARDALPGDAFHEELLGYMSAVWKDVTTTKGLPFFTWTKDQYDASATWVVDHIPFATRDWFYDLMSFDAFEVLSTSLGVAGAVFCLRKDDTEKLAEILGAAGVTAVIGANPLGGIAMIFVAAYAYAVKKRKFHKIAFAKGMGLTAVSVAAFAILGLPILIELGMVIVLTTLLRKHVLDNQAAADFIQRRIQALSTQFGTVATSWRVRFNRQGEPVATAIAAAIDTKSADDSDC